MFFAGVDGLNQMHEAAKDGLNQHVPRPPAIEGPEKWLSGYLPAAPRLKTASKIYTYHIYMISCSVIQSHVISVKTWRLFDGIALFIETIQTLKKNVYIYIKMYVEYNIDRHIPMIYSLSIYG